jgi:hypothetical protein
MAGNSAWNNAVKIAFKMGRKTRKTYSLKEAMFDAKKIYKKGKNTVVNLGRQTRRRASPNKGYKRRRMHRGGSTTTPKSLSSMTMNGGGEPTTTSKSLLSSLKINGGSATPASATTPKSLLRMNGGSATTASATTPKSLLRMNGGSSTPASATTPKSLLSSLKINGGETEMQLPKMRGGKVPELSPSDVTAK